MSATTWKGVLSLALLTSVRVGCGGCSRKDAGGPDAAGPTAPSAPAADGGSADDEARDRRTRIPRERCEDVSRRYNLMAGRPENDQSTEVVDMNARCVQNGNLAWYQCTLQARRPPDLTACTERFLFQQTVPASGSQRSQ